MSDAPLALVTGGAQGIGYACAEALKEDGMRVVLVDINADVLTAAAKTLGAEAAIVCDMGDPAQITAMFDQVEADLFRQFQCFPGWHHSEVCPFRANHANFRSTDSIISS